MELPTLETIVNKIDEIAADTVSISESLISSNMPASHNLRMIVLRLGKVREELEHTNANNKS